MFKIWYFDIFGNVVNSTRLEVEFAEICEFQESNGWAALPKSYYIWPLHHSREPNKVRKLCEKSMKLHKFEKCPKFEVKFWTFFKFKICPKFGHFQILDIFQI